MARAVPTMDVIKPRLRLRISQLMMDGGSWSKHGLVSALAEKDWLPDVDGQLALVQEQLEGFPDVFARTVDPVVADKHYKLTSVGRSRCSSWLNLLHLNEESIPSPTAWDRLLAGVFG